MCRAGHLSPIFAYLRNPSMMDLPGRLSALFFVSGCNFRCGFCHNASLMGTHRPGASWTRMREICERFRENWVDAAVITGGEPTLAEALPEAIGFFRDMGWAVKLDTNGSRPDMLARCLPLLDYVAMDIKAPLSRYEELTGFRDTDVIQESVRLIREQAHDYEFRTTVLTPFHRDEDILEMGHIIQGARRYILQPFVPRDELPGRTFREMPRSSPERMRALLPILKPYADEVLIRGSDMPGPNPPCY